MHIEIEGDELVTTDKGQRRALGLYTPEAFALIQELWLKVGWSLRYSYAFSWFGRPIIQLPEDIIRIQEVIYAVRPDVLVETGVAHGGSLVFYASLFRAMGRGRVVGVDIEIRPPNRAAIEAHELASLITLVEGDSVSDAVVASVRSGIGERDKVMVVLDSNHSKRHVANELRAYASMVSVGSYIVVTDGVMEQLSDAPGGAADWKSDNPCAATREFLAADNRFVLEPPAPAFDESKVSARPTYWPLAYLRRVK
ncbi:MAG TPA: CmcI family methyltransferase [Polyangia bacterium]|jgi:cephalosporin hydroxylase